MPILFVYGIPHGHASNVQTCFLEKLVLQLRKTVGFFPEFQLMEDQVSVFLVPDLVQKGLGEEIIVIVEGLFVTPQRTLERRKMWANTIGTVLRDFASPHIPQCNKIEVLVRSFDTQVEAFSERLISKR